MGKLTHTVKGPIASFRSADKANIESLKLHFLPKQEGSGDASYQNIRPLLGWNGCYALATGTNVWDEQTEPGTISISNGENSNTGLNSQIRTKNYVPVVGGVEYAVITGGSGATYGIWMLFYDKNKDLITTGLPNGNSSAQNGRRFDNGAKVLMPDNCAYIKWYFQLYYGTTYKNDTGLNYPSTSVSYTPYTGETIPIAFPSTRNLLDTSTHETDTHVVKKGITFDYNMDGSLTVNGSVDSDAASGPQYRMAVWTQQESGNFYLSCIAPFSTTYNEVYIYDNHLSKRPKKWDGETPSTSAGSNRQLSEVQLIAGHSYSVNVRINCGYDKTYANNKFYCMILRSTDTNTNYEPYGVFYGGYIDPVRGKLVREYTIGILDGTEPSYTISGGQGYRFGTQRGYTSLKGDFNKPVLYAATDTNPSIRSNMFLTKPANSLYNGEIGIGIGDDGSTIWMCYGETGMTEEKIRAFLSAHPVQLAYKLNTPIEYDLTPTELQTFLDYNNFWSDMNDDTEVEYEFADRLSTRKALFQPKTRIVNWNQISLDGNFSGC